MTAAAVDPDKAKRRCQRLKGRERKQISTRPATKKPQACKNDEQGEFGGSMRAERSIRMQQSEVHMSPRIPAEEPLQKQPADTQE